MNLPRALALSASEPIPSTDPTTIILPPDATKDAKHRLTKFAAWLITNRQPWHRLDLAAYRDHLLDDGYASATVSAHLSTVRARYRDLIRNRDRLYTIAARQTDNPLERKALVDELVTRLENAIHPAAAPVKTRSSQDRPDTVHLRLTAHQASQLMDAPGVDTRPGLRNTSIIALLLCTGIREAELSALETRDLRQRLGGELALHVRQGKGCKERLIPYGALEWVLAIIDKWHQAVGITDGPVFRGYYKGNRRLRLGPLSVRAIQYVLASYPIVVDGQLTTVRPHDLRRTYARRLYEAGVDLVAIQQNLGHADLKTTLGYIGTLDVAARRAPDLYQFDLGKLAAVPVQASTF